jgi:hypothetical protein
VWLSIYIELQPDSNRNAVMTFSPGLAAKRLPWESVNGSLSTATRLRQRLNENRIWVGFQTNCALC